ncbi:MAG: UbiD family decarboxylase [Bacteroidota bacterium]
MSSSRYISLKDCLDDLEKHGHLVRIIEEVDPNLEMAAIHLRVFEAGGPSIFFEKVKGSTFPAASNLFGTPDRSRFMFRDTLEKVKQLITLKHDPLKILKNPFKYALAFKTLPKRSKWRNPILFGETQIDQLPQIKCWPNDGGAYILLPQVYTEDIDKPGVMNSNLGMYRTQMNGNDYTPNKEVGLHYQIHRGIGIHQAKANANGKPLKASIFVGGPPAHTLAAAMPLPEGLTELTFAGALGGRRFRYSYENGYLISSDADFVITGEIYHRENKPEGPFGDHLGYYSLKHDFPVMRVQKVYHRKNAIWPFTVVGRPPQEDTSFGALIHEIVSQVIPKEIPGLHEIHNVDAAGVHPLLLAIGSERYTPYYKERKPQELLTIANRILGYGQLSLAKYLIIVAKEDNPQLDIYNIENFFTHVLERVDWTRDLHFHTQTTIDTLDYSGTGLNTGSKVVIAAAGEKIRELSKEIPSDFSLPNCFNDPKVVLPGILAISGPKYADVETTKKDINILTTHNSFIHRSFSEGGQLSNHQLKNFPLILLTDNSDFTSKTLNNFLWTTFTKSNPSHDIHGIESFIDNKHWGCRGSLIIDARIKSHHAPELVKDPEIEKRVDALGAKGKSLYGII